MRDSELRRTVELPAQRAGLEIEGGLVEVIVSEVAGRAGALPLLSTALAETWERREGRALTLAGYRAAGGVNGALARMAEGAYAGLPPAPRTAARRLLLRLCDAGEEGDLTLRRRLPIAEATDEDDADTRGALEALADRRLLTIDRDSVELAHEALLREWPRLRTWLDEDVQGRRLHRRLHDATRSREASDHDPSELYRGARLGAATDWAASHDDELSQPERAFLAASQARSERELADARRQAADRARANRRLRTLLAGVGVLLVVAVVVGLVAVNQQERANEEARVAEARELAAAATANLDVDSERSVLLALEAVERTQSDDGSVLPEAEEALHRAVVASRIVMSVPDVGGRVDWSPDDTIFVTEGPEDTGLVDIRDAETGESVRSFHGHDKDINDVGFSHDGSMLATTGDDGAARVWDPTTGQQLRSFEGPPDSLVWGPSFSPDGSLFAAAWTDEGVTRVLDLATGRTVHEISVVAAPDRTSFSPDGEKLAISGSGSVAVVVDARSGETVFTLAGHKWTLTGVAWSPDGRWIATSSRDGTARIWDADTGTLRHTLVGHGAWVQDVGWSPGSDRLVTGSSDGTAKVWTVTEESARELLSLSAQGTSSGIDGVAYSPDGDRIMAGDESITAVEVWDVSITGGAEWANLPAVPFFPGSATFTPDGRRLVASTVGGSATVWDATAGTRLLTFGPDGPWANPDGADVLAIDPLIDRPSGANVLAIDVSSDGELIATASADGSAKVWDAATGNEMFTLPSGPGVDYLAWSPDGSLLATASVQGDAGLVTIVNRSGQKVAVLREEPGVRFGSVRFSPDGRLLVASRVSVGRPDPSVPEVRIWDWERGEVVKTIDAAAERAFYDPTGDRIAITTRAPAGDGTAEIWDARTGHKIATLAGHRGVFNIAFAPDGSRVATAAFDGTVRLWDPESGEQLLVLRGHAALVSSVAFSPDGSKLASVGPDGTVRVWALDLHDLIEIAKSRVTRRLTDEECQQYLHGSRCP
jgi:WD40 repeat protein